MNAELKRKWVDALRSGDYPQGKVYLRREDDHYCCLGVLCDLVAPEQWVRHDEWNFEYGADISPIALPKEMSRDLGLDGEYEGLLIKMNDDGTPFDKIADWIEATVEADA